MKGMIVTGKSLAPLEADEAICRLSLEKMADSLEDGTGAFLDEGVRKPGAAVREACWILAKKFAEIAKDKDCDIRFEKGPYSGLALVAWLVGHPNLGADEKDMERLVGCVALARNIPVDAPAIGPGEEAMALKNEIQGCVGDLKKRREESRDR